MAAATTAAPAQAAPQQLQITVLTQATQAAHAHVKRHRQKYRLASVVGSIGVLIVLLRTQGKKLRNDWTPIGLGVKALLVGCVLSLLYYPYEMFLKGPDAIDRALKGG